MRGDEAREAREVREAGEEEAEAAVAVAAAAAGRRRTLPLSIVKSPNKLEDVCIRLT